MKNTTGRLFATGFVLLVALLVTLVAADRTFSHGNLNLPRLPAPEEYGDVLINKFSGEKKVIPVIFSHWVHRTKYTCRYCHIDLDFAMRAGDTGAVCGGGEMTGKFCTVCHDNKTAFGPKGQAGEKNCERCHNANVSPNREKFEALQKQLPAAPYGNKIDWVKAFERGLIKPKRSMNNDFAPIVMDRTLKLHAEMSGIPPAVFPHKTHEEWLGCENCHPDIFNIKKKTTKHFSMWRILNKEFCGVCHLRIAFPLDDCKRCHPDMK